MPPAESLNSPNLDAEPPLFELLQDSGVDFSHRHGGRGQRELPETLGAGMALLDADADGDLDLYCVQSGDLLAPEDSAAEQDDREGNSLYANDGRAHFTKLPGALGADDSGYGMGAVVGDADGDGRDDIYCTNYGPNALYLNKRNGFAPATSELGLDEQSWSISAAFFDAEGDGDLDLYVANYVHYPLGAYRNPKFNDRAPNGFAQYPHPDGFASQSDRLYRNDGARGFYDASAEAGVDVEAGKGLGVLPLDVNFDGNLDLYITNDGTPNFLFMNDGAWKFEPSGRRMEAAFNGNGLTEASMGVDCADINGDGRWDLFATHLDLETNTLYLSQASGLFRDRTQQVGLAEPSLLLVGFGTRFADLDLDGHSDLLIANGHIIDNVETISDTRTYAQPNQLFRNTGRGHFELDPRVPSAWLEPRVSRSLALGDINGDGHPDWVVGNNNGRPQIYVGLPPDKARLSVRLIGPAGNPRGLGASLRLELESGQSILGRIDTSGSYASSSAASFCTGLPARLLAVEVLWPGGRRERFEQPASTNSKLVLEHGAGRSM